MNEKIKLLAEQAGPNTEEELNDDRTNIYVIDVEKFAELIVKECAKVINADIEYQIKDGIISNVHGLNQARNLIKEHFGVEE